MVWPRPGARALRGSLKRWSSARATCAPLRPGLQGLAARTNAKVPARIMGSPAPVLGMSPRLGIRPLGSMWVMRMPTAKRRVKMAHVFGLDHAIAGLSGGGALLVVLGIALLLGLRHASDPDHVAAVTTLATGGGAGSRPAARLGLAWGLGHATSLFAFGLPIVLWRAYLPATLQHATEAAVGVMIVALAVWLFMRWRTGALTSRRAASRSGRAAYGIGLVHGASGSAGIGILLLAAIPQRSVALAGLAVFALGTAASMTLLSAGFGRALSREWVTRFAPALAAVSLVLGLWWATAALS